MKLGSKKLTNCTHRFKRGTVTEPTHRHSKVFLGGRSSIYVLRAPCKKYEHTQSWPKINVHAPNLVTTLEGKTGTGTLKSSVNQIDHAYDVNEQQS